MVNLKSHFKEAARSFLFIPSVKSSIETLPVLNKIYPPVFRKHPFDKTYGIDTSGHVAQEKIHGDPRMQAMIHAYGGSQPSIVRASLATLGDVSEYCFADLGCGKGRATTVASEFSFRKVIGVELSQDLTDIGRENAAKMARSHPSRPKVEIEQGNVIDFPLPEGKVVFFNYHAFGRELFAQMLQRFEAALAGGKIEHMFFVYYNPVFAELVDESPAFERFYAGERPYDKTELGFGPDRDDVFAVWQSIQGATLPPDKEASRKIVAVHKMRAALAK